MGGSSASRKSPPRSKTAFRDCRKCSTTWTRRGRNCSGSEPPPQFSSLPAAVGIITGGRLKALAVSTVKRSKALPEVPTVMESGVPGYEVLYWYGLFVPASTPREIVDRLHNEIMQALRAQDVPRT